MVTPQQSNLDLTILINWSLPFDANRVEALDQVVDYMFKGTKQEVSL